MAFSYSPHDLATNPVHQVRFYLGDTCHPGVFSNEEIAFMVAEAGSACMAAVDLIRRDAQRIGAQGSMSRTIGDLSISGGGGGVEQMLAWADSLEQRCRTRSALPTEISYGADELEQAPHLFELGQFDNNREGGDPRVPRYDWPPESPSSI